MLVRRQSAVEVQWRHTLRAAGTTSHHSPQLVATEGTLREGRTTRGFKVIAGRPAAGEHHCLSRPLSPQRVARLTLRHLPAVSLLASSLLLLLPPTLSHWANSADLPFIWRQSLVDSQCQFILFPILCALPTACLSIHFFSGDIDTTHHCHHRATEQARFVDVLMIMMMMMLLCRQFLACWSSHNSSLLAREKE